MQNITFSNMYKLFSVILYHIANFEFTMSQILSNFEVVLEKH